MRYPNEEEYYSEAEFHKEGNMQTYVGYFLIIVGLALVILAVLVSLNVIETRSPLILEQSSWIDFLIALLNKAPWFGVVGLLLIYAGLKMIGINLPF